MGTTESERLLGSTQGWLVQLIVQILNFSLVSDIPRVRTGDARDGPMASTIGRHPRRTQSGGFLLEALLAMLIFLVGVLCVIAMQAHALRAINDSHYRAEAAYLANRLLAQMWADDRSILKIEYDSTLGGTRYRAFQSAASTLPGASLKSPDVIFDDALAPSAGSSFVTIRIYWRAPGEDRESADAAFWHSYTMSGVVGQN